MAFMLIQKQFLELITSAYWGLFWKHYALEICLQMKNRA